MSEQDEKGIKEKIKSVNVVGLTAKIISAAKYYQGKPDGKYFTSKDFPDEVVQAPKAYITINTLMEGDTSEEERFREGKKHIPGIITPKGIEKIIELHKDLFWFGLNNPAEWIETTRACKRTSEVSSGVVSSLMSTTKNTINEIYGLGYGDKTGLAICNYRFHKGAVIFDMEKLGEDYLVPEEREILILPGNQLVSTKIGEDSTHKGIDGKNGIVYEIDVYAPQLEDVTEIEASLKETVYDNDMIEQVRNFYEQLNQNIGTTNYPVEPKGYRDWKKAFQNLVFLNLYKATEQFGAGNASSLENKSTTVKQTSTEEE